MKRSPRCRRVLLVLSVLSLVLASTAPALAARGFRKITTGTRPAVSPDGQWIAFMRNRDGNADVWVCRLDGSQERRITSHPSWDGSPEWSPDGRTLVFSSGRDGGRHLYTVPADGSAEPERLTRGEGRNDDPAWSPDGTTIAFTSFRSGVGASIGMIPAGGGAISYREVFGRLGELSDPTWSPDGRRLAAVTERDAHYDVVVLYLNEEQGTGLGPETVSVGLTDELEPSWHPSRDLILFTSDRDYEEVAEARGLEQIPPRGGPAEIEMNRVDPPDLRFVYMGAPGKRPRLRQCTLPPYSASQPDWTPDGRSLVYVRGEGIDDPRWQLDEPEIWIRESFLRAEKEKKNKKKR